MPQSRTGGVLVQSRTPSLGLRAGPSPLGLLLLLMILLTSPLSSVCGAPAPPKFTKIPTDQIGVSGGVASFVCQATGHPKPVVYWNKKGKKVNSQRIEVVVTMHNGQRLLQKHNEYKAVFDKDMWMYTTAMSRSYSIFPDI